jgi:hypothetical protein
MNLRVPQNTGSFFTSSAYKELYKDNSAMWNLLVFYILCIFFTSVVFERIVIKYKCEIHEKGTCDRQNTLLIFVKEWPKPCLLKHLTVCLLSFSFILPSWSEDTLRHDRMINTPASYTGGTKFQSRPRYWLFLGVSWFSSILPGKYRDTTLKLGHDRFLPNPLHFINHFSTFHSTLCNLCYWKRVVK